MKLTNIILNEYGEFKKEENELKRKLNSTLSSDYNLYVSIGAYSGDRPDSDPLKGRGFGSVSFIHKEDIPEEDFSKAIDVINKSGYEVDLKQSDRFYDYEPGERDFFPRIKFGFKIQ